MFIYFIFIVESEAQKNIFDFWFLKMCFKWA